MLQRFSGATRCFPRVLVAGVPRLLAAFVMLAALAVPGTAARAIETDAQAAIIVDYDTQAVLFAKNPDMLIHPASMTKMMTAHIAFERLKTGRMSMEDTIAISEKAWRMGGSKMFVEVNSRVSIADIMRGIVIQSGNDAAVALAEAISGSEEAFAEEMTRHARALGMTKTVFRNATGWPDPDHLTTVRDLATLAAATIRDFPEYYPIYAEKTFTYNNIRQGNRNPLLYKSMGADGLKTGHTEEAGYGLTASVVRNGRRLILAFGGTKEMRDRAQEAETLIDWAFREYENYTLIKAGEEIDKGKVWLGDRKVVPLIAGTDLVVTMKRASRREMKVVVEYDQPIPAPIAKGQKVASLRITAPGQDDIVTPLLAGDNIGRLGVLGRVTAAVGYLLWGGSG